MVASQPHKFELSAAESQTFGSPLWPTGALLMVTVQVGVLSPVADATKGAGVVAATRQPCRVVLTWFKTDGANVPQEG